MSDLSIKDKKLAKWLKGTNWPEGFDFRHEVEMKKTQEGLKVLDKVIIFKGINKVEYYMNAKVLTRGQFDHVVKSTIDIINKDYELNTNIGLGQEIKRNEDQLRELDETWKKLP